MSRRTTIVDRFLSGEEYDFARIDDEIDLWHESETDVTLHEWLGFTEDEYALFVEKPDCIRAILDARRQGISPLQLAKQAQVTALAARGANPGEVEELRRWLTATGRL